MVYGFDLFGLSMSNDGIIEKDMPKYLFIWIFGMLKEEIIEKDMP